MEISTEAPTPSTGDRDAEHPGRAVNEGDIFCILGVGGSGDMTFSEDGERTLRGILYLGNMHVFERTVWSTLINSC